MDEFILSEVCYKNGFKDGQNTPVYVLIGFGELPCTVSHDISFLEALVQKNNYFENQIIIRKYNLQTLGFGTHCKSFFWDYTKKCYEE